MGLDESEVFRLLRGDVPSDDPVWGEVSSFLDTVGTVYPIVPPAASEGRHLAAVDRESRLVQSELQRPRQGAVKRLFQGTNRVLAGSVGAFLIALTVGIGVASALGNNPLEQLFAPLPAASPVVPQASSAETNSSDPADGVRDDELGTVPPESVPSSIPTSTDLPTPGSTGPSADANDDAAKASAKAEKQAAKDAAKAKKEAEKAAEKARMEAEKAAEAARAAEKDNATGKPTPPPGQGSDKDG